MRRSGRPAAGWVAIGFALAKAGVFQNTSW